MLRSSLTSRLSNLLLGAALAAGAAACGDTPSTGTSSEDIIGGFPARSAKMNAVGALGYDPSGAGPFRPVCTGTLINPTMVLTAEHCVEFVTDPSQMKFLIGFDAYAPTRIVPVRGISMEQSFGGGAIGLGIDVAVLHLGESVTNVTPFPVATPSSAQLGTRFAGIGYGVQNSVGAHGTRMAGSMTYQQSGGRLYEAIYGTFEDFIADWERFGLDPSIPENLAIYQQAWDQELLQEDGIEGWFGNGQGDAQACFGDSGGPITALINGKTTVFGVASWVAYADGNDLCELGAAYSQLNPQALDFLAYETACPLIPREGTCQDTTTVVRCATPEEGGYRPLSTDCSTLGLICGVDEAGELGCVEDPCEGIPAEGVCDGETAVRCTTPEEGPRRVVNIDCALIGGTCGFEDGSVTCVGTECGHDTCSVGEALEPSCNSCIADICALDPFCCEVSWDAICVGEVGSVCGTPCEGAPIIAPGSR